MPSTPLAGADRETFDGMPHDVADRALGLTGDGFQTRKDLG